MPTTYSSPPARCRRASLRHALAVLGVVSFGILVTPACDADGGCDPPCSVGFTCSAGQCVPGGAAAPGTVGAACGSPGDCDSRVCLSPVSFPGGYCSQTCGAAIATVGPQCPPGGTCVQLQEGSAACMQPCPRGVDDCRTGYACRSIQGQPVCAPGCTDDRSCPQGSGCNTATGDCEAGLAGPGRVGAACALDHECDSQVCVSEALSEGVFPGGYCVRGCDAPQVAQFCPDRDGICVDLEDDDGSPIYACLAACTTSVDCRQGYTCTSDVGIRTDDGYGVCIPRCEAYGCWPGTTCDPRGGMCVDSTGPGPGPGGPPGEVVVTTSTLIEAGMGPNPHEFREVTVNVEPGTLSFAIAASPSPLSGEAVPVAIRAPNGQYLWDVFDPFASSFSVAYFEGRHGIMFPNTPRLTLAPGAYTFTYGSMPAAQVRLDLITKRGPGDLAGGQLPVIFWFARQGYANAQSAQTDPVFQEAVQVFQQIYAQAGIQLGPFTYLDLHEPQATRFAVVAEGDLPEMFALPQGSTHEGLHFVMIDHFIMPGGGVLLGISGGIPGPPAVGGVPRGSVAVGLASYMGGAGTPGGLGETMAHEGGHYLGLFHTTEANGQSFDPLPDTPECPASTRDLDGDGYVNPDECVGFGSTNLMFWSASDQLQRELTPNQTWVLLRNPSVR